MEKKIIIKIKVREDGCSLGADCMGKKPFCELDRDDDSITAAEKILESLGFEVEVVDRDNDEEDEEDEE